ncbi:hypothetical protein [Bacillus sp. Hm123]|uniref:hypothetical protein n=1 Tax=Bacillus sp. Hm123 TaxID=3450745 RepID=UPI003F41B5A5
MKMLVIYLLVPIVWVLIISWFTGRKEYMFQSNDDERKQHIKQKAIVQSWTALILFFLTNFFIDFFHLHDERLDEVPFVFPELLYLLIALFSYFIFFFINNKKMSAH